jgi:hypothetical protein
MVGFALFVEEVFLQINLYVHVEEIINIYQCLFTQVIPYIHIIGGKKLPVVPKDNIIKIKS